jgi:hypothetical protein
MTRYGVYASEIRFLPPFVKVKSTCIRLSSVGSNEIMMRLSTIGLILTSSADAWRVAAYSHIIVISSLPTVSHWDPVGTKARERPLRGTFRSLLIPGPVLTGGLQNAGKVEVANAANNAQLPTARSTRLGQIPNRVIVNLLILWSEEGYWASDGSWLGSSQLNSADSGAAFICPRIFLSFKGYLASARLVGLDYGLEV